MRATKKGFLDHFTEREDRLIADGFILAALAGLALATAVFLLLASSPSTEHAYLDAAFWGITAAPVLVFFVAFLVVTWLRRRKSWYPVPGS